MIRHPHVRQLEPQMVALPDDWTPRLAQALAAALQEFSESLRGKTAIALDVGCFPWHGSFELSVLTAEEFENDSALMQPGEQAAWPHYNFSGGLASWTATAVLGHQMRELYQTAGEGERAAAVSMFLRAVAVATASPEVTNALTSLKRDPRFQVFVMHPDDGQQFFPPG